MLRVSTKASIVPIFTRLLVRSAVGVPVGVHASLLAISEVGEAVAVRRISMLYMHTRKEVYLLVRVVHVVGDGVSAGKGGAGVTANLAVVGLLRLEGGVRNVVSVTTALVALEGVVDCHACKPSGHLSI